MLPETLKLTFHCLVSLCLLTALAWHIGRLLRKFFADPSGEDQLTKSFWNLLLGLMALVFFYAVVMTKGRTVMLHFILPGLTYLMFTKWNLKNILNKREVKGVPDTTEHNLPRTSQICVIFLMLFNFLLFMVRKTDVITGSIFNIGNDSNFYASTANYLNNGWENTMLFCNWVDPAIQTSLAPYHYFEIWLIAFLAKICRLPVLLGTDIVIPALMHNLLFLALLCSNIANKIKISNLRIVFVYTVSHFCLPSLYLILFRVLHIKYNFFWYYGFDTKAIMTACCLLGSVFLLQKREYILVGLLILCPIAMDCAWIPALYAGYCGYLLWFYFHLQPSEKIKKTLPLCIAGGLSIVLIIFFYSQTLDSSGSNPATATKMLALPSFGNFFRCLRPSLVYIVVFSPLVFFFYLIRRKLPISIIAEKYICILLIFMMIGGILGYWICFHIPDSTQLTITYKLATIFLWYYLVNCPWTAINGIYRYISICFLSAILLTAAQKWLRYMKGWHSKAPSQETLAYFQKTYHQVKACQQEQGKVFIGIFHKWAQNQGLENLEVCHIAFPQIRLSLSCNDRLNNVYYVSCSPLLADGNLFIQEELPWAWNQINLGAYHFCRMSGLHYPFPKDYITPFCSRLDFIELEADVELPVSLEDFCELVAEHPKTQKRFYKVKSKLPFFANDQK